MMFSNYLSGGTMLSRPEKKLHFLEHFSSIPDHRVPGMITYPMDELLLTCLCAVLSGSDDWEEISFWGKEHLDFLRQFLPFTHGVASPRTFRDVFALLDAKAFQQCFTTWMESMLGAVSGVVSIDGKTIRASATNNTPATHIVSAFAHTRGLIMGQCAVKEKSNEISAIPELLAALALQGCIITIDAMGCQKAIASQIIKIGADYILALKGNQSGLHNDVKLFFESPPEGFTIASSETLDKGHGRVERRICSVTSDIEWLKEHHSWQNIQTIIRIDSEVSKAGKSSRETRYFISSLAPDAARILACVRSHWGVEAMHWSLDVTFRDDYSTARKDHSAMNLSTFKRAAYNLLKQNTEKIPLKHKRRKAAWNQSFLCSLLTH